VLVFLNYFLLAPAETFRSMVVPALISLDLYDPVSRIDLAIRITSLALGPCFSN
jgi:hypothetical protein